MQKSTTLVAVAIPIVSFGLPLLDTMLAVVRRFLSGQPLFTADREHIHHKLLKRGFTHKQVVVMLYGVCAVLGLASLLLLYPQGSATGIVLTVLGIGTFFGVQHLGYHEFAELGRAAKCTVDQKQIIVNNLSVRRATEELASADDLESVFTILKSAFATNEFDSFDLVFRPPYCDHEIVAHSFVKTSDGSYRAAWRKHRATATSACWQLSLALNSSVLGQNASFTVHRGRTTRNLLFDINLLAGEFQAALSNALGRALEETPQTAVLTSMRTVPAAALRRAIAAQQQ
jgi:hypothetical protein